MKKVLFVINTMGRAGAERSLISLLKALGDEQHKNQFEISLLSIIPQGEFFESVPDYVKILNTRYTARTLMDFRGRMACALESLKALFSRFYIIRNFPALMKSLAKQLRNDYFSPEKVLWQALASYAPVPNEKYDLAVAFIEGAASYFVSERVQAKKKAMFMHTDYSKAGYSAEQDLPYYQGFDRVFAVSEAVKTRFVEAFPGLSEKTVVFHNIIDTQAIDSMRTDGSGFDDGFDGLRLLTVGRLHYLKGHDIAIEAMSMLVAECDLKIRWYVIGRGSEEASLRSSIKSKGLDDKFILLGEKANPYPFIDQCDIYVHASRYEGASIAIAEAKYLCKPIIASDVAGIREQLSQDSSVIINLDKRELVDAIKLLAANPDMRERFSFALAEKADSPNDIDKLYALIETEV